jgi:DNA anti-recombination protein RmuC
MDIAGTKKRIQRLIKVAEESYKKISQLLEQMEQLQTDLETTSTQVDHMEYELAEQRVLLEAIADGQDIDVETLLAEADLPPEPDTEAETDDDPEDEPNSSEQATSRPSASTDTE